ncbi:MAG: hypothetical protein L3J56_03015 [Bacteroidales bacterium]|nr:hypothetical protein [Bacteroidales bacterium]
MFLFLHVCLFGFGQKYTLKINSVSTELQEKIIKKARGKTFSDSALIYKYLQKIRNELFSEGYIAASFDSVKFDTSSVTAYLFPGKKYHINQLLITDIYPVLRRKYHINNSAAGTKGFVNPADLLNLYDDIIKEYENVGFPFATLIPKDVEIQNNEIKLNLQLQKNKLIRFHKIVIKGNAKISPIFLSRYLSVYEGDVYNEELINSASSKIEALPFLSVIRSPEVDFFNDKADLYLYLKNKKANLFNGLIGFLPDKNNDNKLSFTGNIDLKLLNNFGKGETIFLSWSRTAALSQKLNVGFTVPYIFKSPFLIHSQFKSDKRDTSFLKISGKLGVDFSFKNNDLITAYVRQKQSLLLSEQNIDTSIFKNTKVLLFGLSYKSQKYDYFPNPSRAYLFDVGFAGGNRTVSSEKKPYYETNIRAEYYIPLYRRFVLKLTSDSRYAFPYERLYENELFELGGFKTLKGFSENRFRTSAYSVFNLEPRFLYEANSNVFVFFNTAIIRDNSVPVGYILPYGFGAGTNLSTKAGIFSVSYAFGTLAGNSLQFSDSEIHIGYINRF